MLSFILRTLEMNYSYIIIGNSASSNLQLQHFLEEYNDFSCVDISENSNVALNSILKYSPDIIFVDLQKNTREYFQMVSDLHQYIDQIPLIIGVSTSKDYAYDAIKNGFFDYWLLPYNEFDIRKAIFKIRKQTPKKETTPTLCLQSYKDYQYIDTSEILYLKADNNATDLFLNNGKKISAFKTLKTFENKLPENFIRIHQSYILNTEYVSRINYGKSICNIKRSDLQLPFSKSYKENIDKLKSKMGKNAISTQN